MASVSGRGTENPKIFFMSMCLLMKNLSCKRGGRKKIQPKHAIKEEDPEKGHLPSTGVGECVYCSSSVFQFIDFLLAPGREMIYEY